MNLKHFIQLLLVGLATTTTFAQVEFAPVGAKQYFQGYTDFKITGTDYFITRIEVLADSSFQGQRCKLMDVSGIMGVCEQFLQPILVYEDGGQVFLWNEVTSAFQILYDFNLVAGESYTIPAYGCLQDGIADSFCLQDDIEVMVDSVSMLDVGGLQIKVQHVRVEGGYVDGPVLIYENIGCNRHFLFGSDDNLCTTIHAYITNLNCYYSPIEGEISFVGDSIPCGELSSTETPVISLHQVQVYPNPTDGLIYIDQGEANVAAYRVLAMDGRLVQEAGMEISETEAVIDITGQDAGVYLLQLLDDAGRSTVRRVVRQ